jgi:hypothetical protein
MPMHRLGSRIPALVALTAACAVPAAAAAAPHAAASARPTGRVLRWAAKGNRALGTVRLTSDSVVRWTDATGSFSLRDAAGHLKASSSTRGGQTFAARGTFRKVTVRAKGSWTLTITPLPAAHR